MNQVKQKYDKCVRHSSVSSSSPRWPIKMAIQSNDSIFCCRCSTSALILNMYTIVRRWVRACVRACLDQHIVVRLYWSADHCCTLCKEMNFMTTSLFRFYSIKFVWFNFVCVIPELWNNLGLTKTLEKQMRMESARKKMVFFWLKSSQCSINYGNQSTRCDFNRTQVNKIPTTNNCKSDLLVGNLIAAAMTTIDFFSFHYWLATNSWRRRSVAPWWPEHFVASDVCKCA